MRQGDAGDIPHVGGPDGGHRLGKDVLISLDIVDDRSSDVDFLFQEIQLQGIGSTRIRADIHCRNQKR